MHEESQEATRKSPTKARFEGEVERRSQVERQVDVQEQRSGQGKLSLKSKHKSIHAFRPTFRLCDEARKKSAKSRNASRYVHFDFDANLGPI